MKSIQNPPVRMVIILLSIVLSVSAGRTIFGLWQRRDIVEERARELKNLREKNVSLQRVLQDMQDASYVERVARNTLGLVKEGESIVLLPQAEERHNSGKEKEDGFGPVWRRWWRLFF